MLTHLNPSILNYLSNQVGVSDNSSYEKPMIRDFSSFFNFGRSKVEMHAMIISWQCFQMKISHPVEFQLESESWFQVTVYSVFIELN